MGLLEWYKKSRLCSALGVVKKQEKSLIGYLHTCYLGGGMNEAELKLYLVKEQQSFKLARKGRSSVIFVVWTNSCFGFGSLNYFSGVLVFRHDYRVFLFFLASSFSKWLCLLLIFCEIVYGQNESWEFQASIWLSAAASICLTIILQSKSYYFPNGETKT